MPRTCPVHVDRVGEALERVKRDADRQDDLERAVARRQSDCGEHRGTFSTKKLKYLKNPSSPRFATRLSQNTRFLWAGSASIFSATK